MGGKTQQRDSLRESSSRRSDGSLTVTQAMRNILIFIFFLNLLNTLGYNTGLLTYKATEADIIWSTIIGVLSFVGMLWLMLLGKK